MFNLDEVPMDGRHVLLHSKTHGWIEGWFSKGEWSDDTPFSPREYSGDVWVLGDDLQQIEVEFGPEGQVYHGSELDGWLPIGDVLAAIPAIIAKREREARYSEALYVLHKKGIKLSDRELSHIQHHAAANRSIKSEPSGSPHGVKWVIDYDQ